VVKSQIQTVRHGEREMTHVPPGRISLREPHIHDPTVLADISWPDVVSHTSTRESFPLEAMSLASQKNATESFLCPRIMAWL